MKTENRPQKGNRVAIVIPSNKPDMSAFEHASYMQCLKVLDKYDTFIAGPEGLDISEYTRLGDVRHYRQDPRFFGTSLRYNRLMLTPQFYEGLSAYDYILIYQLDCYVFRDELEEWCGMGYDYIGGPWINQDLKQWVLKKKRNYPVDMKWLHRLTGYKLLGYVGNGGLSLRKTDSLIRNLKWFSLRLKYYGGNEDVFMAHYLASLNPFFRIPDTSTALKFAFDANPDIAYKMNEERLPFGCHAWWRTDKGTYDHNLDFWSRHINLPAS